MTSLYNCRHSGDQYKITKFDSDLNVESSYICDLDACECPAGHRHTCRHRQMLPQFIDRQHIGDDWFLDFDRGGWVQMGHPFGTAAKAADSLMEEIPFSATGNATGAQSALINLQEAQQSAEKKFHTDLFNPPLSPSTSSIRRRV